jgi:hypothetical protein
MASDPWDDPIEEIRRVREDDERRRAESAARSQEYARFQFLLERAGLLTASLEEFAALGEQLRNRGYEFWIEFSLLVVRREHEVRKLARPGRDAARQRAVGQFILAACRGEELGERLARLRSHVHEGTISDLIEAMHSTISTWMGTKNYPPTPHMTRQELVAACKNIRGMSNPSIGRAIEKGRITTREPIGEFVRFEHKDAKIHRDILSACMTFLSTEKKT